MSARSPCGASRNLATSRSIEIITKTAPPFVGPTDVLSEAPSDSQLDLMRSLLQPKINPLLPTEAAAVVGTDRDWGTSRLDRTIQRNDYRIDESLEAAVVIEPHHPRRLTSAASQQCRSAIGPVAATEIWALLRVSVG